MIAAGVRLGIAAFTPTYLVGSIALASHAPAAIVVIDQATTGGSVLMRLLNLAFFQLFLLCASTQATTADGVADCTTLDRCVARLRQLAQVQAQHPSFDVNPSLRQALEERLREFYGAIPVLIKLLADPNLALANLAASTLAGADYIDPVFLPQVIAGLDRGLDNLPLALPSMHSSNACKEAVARYLASQSAVYGREAGAVKICGSRAIPFIVEAAQCRATCKRGDHYLLGLVLGEMGHERAQAVPGLLRLATDEHTPTEVAAGVLEMIAFLAEDGRALEAKLIALGSRKPELTESVNQALIGIGSQLSGKIYAVRLSRNPNVSTLGDLIESGDAARDAGPAVVALLTYPDWDIRLAAARAVGFIGYRQASTPLIPLLSDHSDVRLNWVAAESLGRLRATDAIDALRKIAADHWYPAVREAAASAVQHIQDGTDYVSHFHRRNLHFELFAYEAMGKQVATCEASQLGRLTEDQSQKLYAKTASRQLKTLSYSADLISAGAIGAPPDKGQNGKPKTIKITPQNWVTQHTPTQQVPTVAMRVKGGWLVGSNRGEWGGELMFIADKASAVLVLNQNVEDIYRLGDRVVVVAGLAHLSMNHGMIFELVRHAGNSWSANPWRALPGAPTASWRLKTGELLVNTVNGGTVLVSAEGSMRMAPCATRR